MSRVHPQARTTPRTRAEIRSSKAPLTELAQRYNVTKATVRKWREREDMQDRSHRPNNLATTLTPIQEMLVVELRRTLLLPLDDLLALLTNSSTLQSPVPAWTGAFGGTASGI